MVVTLDSLEREFLSSILPPLTVSAVAVPYKSYGSCVSVNKNNLKSSASGSASANEFDETKGIEGLDSAYANGSLESGDSRDCTGLDPDCTSASGALSYYLGCRPSNQDNYLDDQNLENDHSSSKNYNNNVNYDESDRTNTQIDRNSEWCYSGGAPKRQKRPTPHHRRSLSGAGGTGAGCLSVPFSLAVEEIGLTAQVM